MQNDGNTSPGLRDVVALDAARLAAAGEGDAWDEADRQMRVKDTDWREQRGVDLTSLPAEEAYKLGGLTVELGRLFAADWLRSPTAFAELMRHHLTDEAGLCGCGQRYTSHVRHLLDSLATVVESS